MIEDHPPGVKNDALCILQPASLGLQGAWEKVIQVSASAATPRDTFGFASTQYTESTPESARRGFGHTARFLFHMYLSFSHPPAWFLISSQFRIPASFIVRSSLFSMLVCSNPWS
jgi:hypothetical protein